MKKSIFYWAPCLDRVGTETSARNSSISLSKFSNKYEVSVINVFGEWNKFSDFFSKNNVKLIKLGPDIYDMLPKTGFFFSRFSYLVIVFFNIIPLIKLIIKSKPDYFIAHLITSLPIILFKFLKSKTKFILRISGKPKLNYFRKYLWKFSSKNLHLITCPTKELQKDIINQQIFDHRKVIFLQDAIINVEEFISKKKDHSFNSEYDFKKNIFYQLED